MKSIFVSHVYEDNKFVDRIKEWGNHEILNDYIFTFEREDKRIEGDKAIHNYLKQKIKGCAILLVLIGNNTHNHDWIRIEVELANSFNKKIFCMRIPNTRGSKPEILKRYKELEFHSNQIVKEIK